MRKTILQHFLPASRRGFTLIEVAIGMALVGIILGGALLITGKLWEQDRREETREHLNETKSKILNFARKHGRLPMMDYNLDGVENLILGNDNSPDLFGWVPYKNIDTKSKDPFGKPVQYYVNWQLAKEGGVRPCQALKNLLIGKVNVLSPTRISYIVQSNWDIPTGNYYIGKPTWYPTLKFNSYSSSSNSPVAAVLVSSGQDYAFNPPHIDAFKISAQNFLVKEQTTDFDDVVVYITISEAYAALSCE